MLNDVVVCVAKRGFWGGGANETAHSQQMKAK